MRFIRHVLIAIAVTVISTRSAAGFALLGPFEPWMTAQLSYQDGGTIGGPMVIGEGYRWNVPVITYGYDESFLDFFGTNGVVAVESAIQLLNSLPPASQIDLTQFATDTARQNWLSNSQSLIDLKSYALAMLLEQMGLAQPTRYVYSLEAISVTNYTAYYTSSLRNYDPLTWEESTNLNGDSYYLDIYINDVWLTGDNPLGSDMFYNGPRSPMIPPTPIYVAQLRPMPAGPFQGYPFSVADAAPGGPFGGLNNYGEFFLGLARDDAGGLAYLLNSNNVAPENLLPGVAGVGTNSSNFVNFALRPGVEKITFQRTDYISPSNHIFPVITNQYVDSYYTNGILHEQTVQRVITQPDILFTANYIGSQIVSRSGTSNWVNNGAAGEGGPGVIQPPVNINFNRTGPSLSYYGYYSSGDASTNDSFWGSYDGSTNPPVMLGGLAPSNYTEFHFILIKPAAGLFQPVGSNQFTWNLTGQPGAVFALQTTTDLKNWLTIGTITNIGGTFTYFDEALTNTPRRYFRTVPQ